MSTLQLILIAVLQGFTEWLPISSSAHVLLAADLFGLEGRDELLLNAASNTGTLAAMLLYFRRDVGAALVGGFELAASRLGRVTPPNRGQHLALAIFIATPPALIGAALFTVLTPESVQDDLRSIYTVAATTIVFGALLLWADVKGGTTRTEADLTRRDAALIGLSQLVAVVLPGTSRSGITMTVARALGYERTEAARFSMLIGAPILAAVSVFGLVGLLRADGESAVTLADGLLVAAVAFISGYASIGLLMAVVRRMSFLPFVLYRFALGIVLILGTPLVGVYSL